MTSSGKDNTKSDFDIARERIFQRFDRYQNDVQSKIAKINKAEEDYNNKTITDREASVILRGITEGTQTTGRFQLNKKFRRSTDIQNLRPSGMAKASHLQNQANEHKTNERIKELKSLLESSLIEITMNEEPTLLGERQLTFSLLCAFLKNLDLSDQDFPKDPVLKDLFLKDLDHIQKSIEEIKHNSLERWGNYLRHLNKVVLISDRLDSNKKIQFKKKIKSLKKSIHSQDMSNDKIFKEIVVLFNELKKINGQEGNTSLYQLIAL